MDIEHIKFAAFFPDCEDIHLTKDVGYIPYVMHRDFGYDSSIICYKNGDYPSLKAETPGLKLLFMKKGVGYFARDRLRALFKKNEVPIRGVESLCIFIDAIPTMLKQGRHIDVLQLYHINDISILIAWLYRMINHKGISYLKLDINPQMILNDEYNKKPSLLYKYAPINIMSVENKKAYNFLKEKDSYFKYYVNNLYYIPNGVFIDKTQQVNYSDKENIIIHVGRIGAKQKASWIILEAFSIVAREFTDWNLLLIGPMDNDFINYFNKYLDDNKDIRDRIKYLGFITREDLLKNYYKAKIIALPSKHEGFSLTSLEASLYGAVMLGSDLPSFEELTDGGKLGYLCPVDDVECFTATLRLMLGNESELAGRSKAVSGFIRDHFDWRQICGELDRQIRSGMRGIK